MGPQGQIQFNHVSNLSLEYQILPQKNYEIFNVANFSKRKKIIKALISHKNL